MSPLRFVAAAVVWVAPLAFWGCTPATVLTAADEHGASVAIRQEWHGSTLVVDLQDVTGHGELVLKRPSTGLATHDIHTQRCHPPGRRGTAGAHGLPPRGAWPRGAGVGFLLLLLLGNPDRNPPVLLSSVLG
jgi:hypothetical protein